MRHGTLLITLTCILALPAASASASTICVGTSRPSCIAPIETDLQTALTRADTSAGADTVLIGPGTFTTAATGGFTSGGTDPIVVEGAGEGRTVIRSTAAAPTAVLAVHASAPAPSAATVRNLSVVGRSIANGASALTISGTLENASATIDGNDPQTTYAIQLRNGSTGREITATALGPFAVGVGMSGALVEGASVTGTIGFEITGPPSTIRRADVVATRNGVDVCNATATVQSSAFQVAGPTSIGIEVEGAQRCAGAASPSHLVARQVTIVGAGGQRQGTGILVSGGNSSPTADVRESVLWNLTSTITAQPQAAVSSSLTVERLDEEAGRRTMGGAGTLNLSDLGGGISLDPMFVDVAGGDVRPATGSPLIDAGKADPLAPDESPLDLAGSPRLVDGNGDGTAQRDLGAFETAAPPPPPPAPTPPAPPPVATTGATPPKDTTAPSLAGLKIKLGRRPVLTITSSEAATLKLEVLTLPKGCKTASRTCKRRVTLTRSLRVKAGTITLRLTKALASKLARRSATARVTAIDPAGNRSARRSVRISR